MRSRAPLAGVAVIVLLVAASPLDLQGQDGFFFGHPRAELTLRAGPMLHRAEGDLFDFFRSELTLDRGDFRALAVSAEVALYAHPRVDIVLGLGASRFETRSEFRDWVDENDLPIEQTTRLTVAPLTASARFYPLGRGRRISSLSWIPARTTPYLGVGGGVSWYRLQQVGDFVTEDTGGESGTIFTDDYSDNAAAPTAHAMAGIQHWISPRFGLNLEGRYTFASATPKGDFTNWDRLDLGGLQLAVGVSYRW